MKDGKKKVVKDDIAKFFQNEALEIYFTNNFQ